MMERGLFSSFSHLYALTQMFPYSAACESFPSLQQSSKANSHARTNRLCWEWNSPDIILSETRANWNAYAVFARLHFSHLTQSCGTWGGTSLLPSPSSSFSSSSSSAPTDLKTSAYSSRVESWTDSPQLRHEASSSRSLG